MECERLLPRPSAQEQCMAFWRKAQCHTASGRLRFGAPGALWTGLAGGLGKPDRHDGLAFGVLAVMPRASVLALWTGHRLVLPVDGEPRNIEGPRDMRLPTRVDMDRSYQLNGMRVAALQDTLGADVPASTKC
jgi:hypothetical protein